MAMLIVSFEASPNNWILQEQNDAGGLHSMMLGLYDSVMTSDAVSLPTLSPQTMSIIKLGADPAYDGRPEQVQKNRATVHRLALIRMLDHVYSLMLDTQIWSAFIAPRTTATVATNLERAKTLRVFAGYLHALLNYHQFFDIEITLKGYELMQQWIQHYPPFTQETTNILEDIIRPHDVLDARSDVATLFSSMGELANQDLGVITLPYEITTLYGITTVLEKAEAEGATLGNTIKVQNLLELDDQRYVPLLGGLPIDELNVSTRVAESVLVNRSLEMAIREKLASLVPVLGRGTSRAVKEALTALAPRTKLPFTIRVAPSYSISKGVNKRIEGNTIHTDRGAASFTYDYHKYLRESFRLTLALDSVIYKGRPNQQVTVLVDVDRTRELKEIIGHSWNGLVPSWLKAGQRVITEELVTVGIDEVRALFEHMSGTSFEMIKKELTLSHLRKLWATFLSSSCLLYVDETVFPSDTAVANAKGGAMASLLTLVEGYGKPYGTDYTNLESVQDGDPLYIPVMPGISLRMLNRIPLPTTSLQYDADFYGKRPTAYFASNSVLHPVKSFVWGDGLEHFCLVPDAPDMPMPAVKFGTRSVYSLARIYINTELFYMPKAADPAREATSLPLVEGTWNLERSSFFLKYIHFGSYANTGMDSEVTGEVSTIEALNRKTEENIKQENAAAAKQVDDAASTATKALNSAAPMGEGHKSDAGERPNQDAEV
jgi:hypothetical protein